MVHDPAVIQGGPEDRTSGVHSTASLPPPPSLESPSPATGSKSTTEKRYARTKLVISLVRSLVSLAFVFLVVATGYASGAEAFFRSYLSNDYLVLLAFTLALGGANGLLTLPLRYYSGFVIEHRYHLSNQSVRKWIGEGTKGMLVGLAIGLPMVVAFFAALRLTGASWWIPVGVLSFLVSIVLARVAPTLIFPLFYKFRPLDQEVLKKKLESLCERVGVPVRGVFVFDLSKNTKKANAAFTGIGRAKRIILGDTLVANFTDDEIETVFAHELGHYRLRHVPVMIGVGLVSTFLGLYLAASLYEASLLWFGFESREIIAALPLLAVWISLYSFVTGPALNALSRLHERQADRYAVSLTGKPQAFVNALHKLARVNLADTDPHPVVEFLFHSHPSIRKRIVAAQQSGGTG